MNQYEARFTNRAKKQLEKLDRPIQIAITKWIESNLNNCSNPYANSVQLSGAPHNVRRYKGAGLPRKYRIIAEVQDKELIILVIEIGKRDHIYDKA